MNAHTEEQRVRRRPCARPDLCRGRRWGPHRLPGGAAPPAPASARRRPHPAATSLMPVDYRNLAGLDGESRVADGVPIAAYDRVVRIAGWAWILSTAILVSASGLWADRQGAILAILGLAGLFILVAHDLLPGPPRPGQVHRRGHRLDRLRDAHRAAHRRSPEPVLLRVRPDRPRCRAGRSSPRHCHAGRARRGELCRRDRGRPPAGWPRRRRDRGRRRQPARAGPARLRGDGGRERAAAVPRGGCAALYDRCSHGPREPGPPDRGGRARDRPGDAIRPRLLAS